MRETTSALTRVALLVLMTGMFAAVWSGDQRTQTEFIVARRAAAEQAIELAQVIPSTAAPIPIDEPVATVSDDQIDSVMHVTVELTLPTDITPGRYRVVQSSGAMFTINVTATGSAATAPRDVYFVDVADGTRQCFIRIDQNDALGQAVRSAAVNDEESLR